MAGLDWLRRWLAEPASAVLAPVLARVLARRSLLVLGVGMAIFYAVAGGLAPGVALVGVVLTVALGALWPMPQADRASGARPPARRSEDDWRRVVDGFPEPALALDYM